MELKEILIALKALTDKVEEALGASGQGDEPQGEGTPPETTKSIEPEAEKGEDITPREEANAPEEAAEAPAEAAEPPKEVLAEEEMPQTAELLNEEAQAEAIEPPKEAEDAVMQKADESPNLDGEDGEELPIDYAEIIEGLNAKNLALEAENKKLRAKVEGAFGLTGKPSGVAKVNPLYDEASDIPPMRRTY